MKIRHLKFSEDLNSKYLTNEFILFFFVFENAIDCRVRD